MATTWAGTAANETVSYNALNDALVNHSIPGGQVAEGYYTGGREATKLVMCGAFAGINVESSPLITKLDSQLVVKSDCKAYNNSHSVAIGTEGGYTSLTDAANETGGIASYTTAFFDDSFGSGVYLRLYAAVDTSKFYSLHGANTGFSITLFDSTYLVYIVTAILTLTST
jgi:hypothetical protein